MTRRIVRSVGLFVVGAALLLSGACSGHSAAIPTTTPPVSSTRQVTPSTVPLASSPGSSTPTTPSSTSATRSTVARSTASTSSSTQAALPTTVSPEQRFTWRVDSSVPKAKDVQAVITAAIPVYRGFMATYDKSLRAPQKQDWEAVMKAYAANSALSKWRAAWQGNIKYNLHREGTASAVARVTAAGTTGINMRVCMDFSQVDVVDKAGKPVPIQTGVPKKGFAWLLTINGTKVVDLVAQTPSGKTFSC